MRVGGSLDRLARATASTLLAVTAMCLSAGRREREWLDALRAELDAIDGGGAQLAWALGGVRFAWALGGRQQMSRAVHRWGPVIGLSLLVGALAGAARTAGLPVVALAGLVGLALGVWWAVSPRAAGRRSEPVAGARGSAPRSAGARTMAVPAAIVGGLLVVGASAAVGAAAQPDTQCTTTRAPLAAPTASPVTAPDYLALGDADYDRGACAEAIAAYTRAIELDPQFAAAYNNRAYTAMRRQDYAAALTDLDRAIALRPDYAHALMNRGDIYNYYYRIDRQRAIADYDRVIALGRPTDSSGSVCGHRLLAASGGWSPAVVLNLLTRGVEGGCAVSTAAH